MKKFILLMICCLLYVITEVNAQQSNYVSNYPTYSIDLRKAGTNNPTSVGGLYTYNGTNYPTYNIGKLASTPTYAHGVYQWNINDLQIPNGSTIHSVTVSFNYN